MPVVAGEKLGPVPVGVVEEVVGPGVVRGGAVHHVDAVISRERDSEGRPLAPRPQPPLDVGGRVVVRAEQQFLGLLAPGP